MVNTVKPNKWKVPAWCVPGAKVRIARGRKVPVGIIGTVSEVITTGNGPQAYIVATPDSPVQFECEPWFSHGTPVWCYNLEPV